MALLADGRTIPDHFELGQQPRPPAIVQLFDAPDAPPSKLPDEKLFLEMSQPSNMQRQDADATLVARKRIPRRKLGKPLYRAAQT